MPDKNPQTKRDRDRLRVARRRAEWVASNGPCKFCSSNEDLEVDHIDPELKLTHRLWSLCEEKRNLELAKCQVLCKACHLEKTKAFLTKEFFHGTVQMYNNRDCRCQPCKDANAEKSRIRRARLRSIRLEADH